MVKKNIFINFEKYKNKRKHLLKTIKSSLEIQQDLEKIKNVREEKINIFIEIEKIFIRINKKKKKLEIGLPKKKITEKEKIINKNKNNLKEKIFSKNPIENTKENRIKNNLKYLEEKLKLLG